ncbi:ammonia-forming cytochrome c nitrite reductase subunit c552 [Myxococcus sp. K15C18031901]|uniref:HEAT repeat domain-containing protein n=1 Tax=Myxococcus dinghuensis TaxID=2906761 RepID=UPI0020A790E4|nr:HEAT repeat domain-containing protein [Myxococcus dinghuensis]MCP3105010.1 ammonia-forming cytochrome c nitrite reductase subunit c552 [Myxococcus dinghuensis]
MRPARPALLAFVLLALLGTAAAVTYSRLRVEPPAAPRAATPAPVAPPTPTASAATPPPAEVNDGHPARGAFAGSAACGECHEDEHAAWGKDWHARALSPATPRFVVGDFKKHPHFKGDSSEAWMRRDGERHFMRTKGADGQLAEFPVQWVVGGKRMQDPVTQMPDGRWQVLPVYFHVTGKGEWVDYSETKQGLLTPDHPFFWTNFRRSTQHACLDCHVTGLDAKYDRATQQWTTRFTDAGVACESCHGPGARHADTQDPKDIVQPADLPPELGFAVCAQCHGPRRPLFPILDAEHRFRPGQRYEDFYQPVVLYVGNERSGDYFTDGRPSTSSFEYQALIQSRCHMQGGATCLTCHTAPHEPQAANELRRADKPSPAVSTGSATCQQCHAKTFEEGTAHTRHTARAAQDCLSCHMPPVVSGVLDKFADHALDVPAPQNTTRHGIPNACNTCHTKQTPEAMAQALTTLWPKSAERQQRRVRLADAFDDATAESGGRAALEAVLADTRETPSLRGVAARVLARRHKREAVPLLRAALKGATDSHLRSDLIESIGTVGGKEATEELVPFLQDTSTWVRQAAALTLASFGDARGLSAVEALASRPETTGLVQPHVMLGQLAMRRKDLTTATREFERALDLQPYNTDVLIRLADVYVFQGQEERGKQRLQEALRFDPQSRAAKQRLSMLQQGR